MNENHDTNYLLHDDTLKLVKEERRLTGLVIENLQKIRDANLHLKMGYSSLFEYTVKALGYSESCAYRRISAMKMACILPEIKEKLNSGDLNLTNLSMAQSFFTKEKVEIARQKEVLEKIENCSKSETEKILVREFGVAALPPKREVVQSSRGDESLLHIRLKQETLKKLDRLKNLRAHKNPSMNYAELISDMCDYMLKRFDPLAKPKKTSAGAKVQATKPTTKSMTQSATKPTAQSANPRFIPTSLKRQIWQRDHGRCTYEDPKTNRRCESQHLLQIDHIYEVCRGGGVTFENLRLLCHAHHRLRHMEPV